MDQTRQQKRAFKRSDEKQTELINSWNENFFTKVMMLRTRRGKKELYRRFCSDWKKYAVWNNNTNENLILDKNLFRNYMEEFYLLTEDKDVSPEWKLCHRELSKSISFFRKIYLHLNKTKIIKEGPFKV